MIDGRAIAAANINGVWPRAVSVAFTSAPLSSRNRTASTPPEAAAVISGVAPRRKTARSHSRRRRAAA